MADIDRLERELRRFAGRDLLPIAREAVVEGKTAPDMQIWINALKECVRHRFLTPKEAMWFKERVLQDCYKPEIKRHLYEKLLSNDVTALFGALTNVQGLSEDKKGVLDIIRSCDLIPHDISIDTANRICSSCGRRIKDIDRITRDKKALCPILNLSSLVDSNIIEITKPANPFDYIERYPVDYIDTWEKEMLKRINAFKRAYMTAPYTNFMHYRDLFRFREKTNLGRKISEIRNKVVELSKEIIKFDNQLEDQLRPRRRGIRHKILRVLRRIKRRKGNV